MTGHHEKRKVPPALEKILKTDVYLTNSLCNLMNKFLPFRSLKIHYKLLEVSCAGYVWLPVWIMLLWIVWKKELMEMQVNFFIGLITDIILVGVLKAVFRRRRPAGNQPDMLGSIGPDVYSFPSGHVSRACFIAYFFLILYPIHFIFRLPLLAWVFSVSASRILLRRHHLLDVFAGVLLGIVNALLISLIWLSENTAVYIVSFISDERIEGSEYDV
ncbi:polyisoprenoid diphosphate/phosphate phosphohydrolase PLPP6-like [Macrosteles quadrilineatus]|uniref:polyisoprenoid diphosphate/phosphate phosphohydrolase PLPP6-like n=1 Tax=Macrosteles quadrilineatus TaxID=74068 RepID=UPI0023E257CB|nr:polyisoprenoid diphosphate/phosphate phosphohydrolase PLPP6-like [Macrosteles quadrilineatus]XP_054276240.1 polyisoprenoid diphosphate/phosphate phosphohydrolase PLPP6-like [Macrosteles quadrilineatus]